MDASVDLTASARATREYHDALRAPADIPDQSDRRRQTRSAHDDCLRALRAATGARRRQADRWLNVVLAGVAALGWSDLGARQTELAALIRLVVTQPPGDERYRALHDLAAANAARDDFLRKVAHRRGDGDAGDRLAELAGAARAHRDAFTTAWAAHPRQP